jgi:hypothetical protein
MVGVKIAIKNTYKAADFLQQSWLFHITDSLEAFRLRLDSIARDGDA